MTDITVLYRNPSPETRRRIINEDNSVIAAGDILAERDALRKALVNAPILSKFNSAEKFCLAYETWVSGYKLPALKVGDY